MKENNGMKLRINCWGREKKEEKMNKKKMGFDFILLGMLAFGGLGLEALYAYLIEPAIYGIPMEDWGDWQTILHWIITCITWGLVSVYLFRSARKEYGFDLLKKASKMKNWQWIGVLIWIFLSGIISYVNWGGFKIAIELQRKGLLLFSFQYIYYAIETVLIMLIIVFAQKAFEVWFQNTKIPYGGIICGVTWGLAHAFTKSSIWIGLQGVLIGFMFGVAYLLVNRDIKKCYGVLFLMFVL